MTHRRRLRFFHPTQIRPRLTCWRMTGALRAAILSSLALVCIAHAADRDEPKMVKINDAISMATTSCNVYVVNTPAGSVVIDTAMADQAPEAKKLLSPQTHGPVKYIVLTHAHADHIGGIPLWKEPGTQIIAQRDHVEFVNYVTRLEGFFAPRNAAAFRRPPKEVGAWA